jgi:hypothetical protein
LAGITITSPPVIHHLDKNLLNKGVLTENSIGIGPVTRELVQARTRELP